MAMGVHQRHFLALAGHAITASPIDNAVSVILHRFEQSEQTLVAQFDVPVREIDEVPPKVMLRSGKRDMHKRAPFRSLRFPNQTHVRLAWKPVTLASIAANT
jgi:hypothetical protein